MSLCTISYGGGVQSSAMIVLAAQGRLGYPVTDALFSNVGDDSEHPATLSYVRDVMTPWAAEHGITVHELHRTLRDGTTETLWGRLTRPGHKATTIPVRGENGAPQSRHCTRDFKVQVVGKWLKAHGATADDPATVCIGISTDEIQRANNKNTENYQRSAYPLLDLGMSRTDCLAVIAQVGLPEPHKSSCFFCPFHSAQTWAEMRRDEPDLFAASVALEGMIQGRQRARGFKPLYITDRGAKLGLPLDQAISEAQQPLFTDGTFADGGCDEGYCWT